MKSECKFCGKVVENPCPTPATAMDCPNMHEVLEEDVPTLEEFLND